MKEAKATSTSEREEKALSSDCPPVDHSTHRTRCAECPRFGAEIPAPLKDLWGRRTHTATAPDAAPGSRGKPSGPGGATSYSAERHSVIRVRAAYRDSRHEAGL